jgi:hypothetical protein
MFHSSTERLIDDWRRRKGRLAAPRRADFSPAALGALMPQLFLLGEDDSFRLVGGLVEDLYGRDLRGSAFTALWSGADAVKAAASMWETRAALQPVVIQALAYTAEGYETRLEIALAPLAGGDGEIERLLGLVQPVSSLARLGGRPIESLSFRGLQHADGTEPAWAGMLTARPPAAAPGLKLVALDGRRVA